MATTDWNQQLLDAAQDGDVELMREALENGADVNTRDDKNGDTPLLHPTVDISKYSDFCRLFPESIEC